MERLTRTAATVHTCPLCRGTGRIAEALPDDVDDGGSLGPDLPDPRPRISSGRTGCDDYDTGNFGPAPTDPGYDSWVDDLFAQWNAGGGL